MSHLTALETFISVKCEGVCSRTVGVSDYFNIFIIYFISEMHCSLCICPFLFHQQVKPFSFACRWLHNTLPLMILFIEDQTGFCKLGLHDIRGKRHFGYVFVIFRFLNSISNYYFPSNCIKANLNVQLQDQIQAKMDL